MSTEEKPAPEGNRENGSKAGSRPVVADHELIRPIGRGSYGEVWLARNVMGAYRAVKIVYRSTFEEDRPFEREFVGIQKFEPVSRSHDSQLNILQVGRNESSGYFYYVMELADNAAERSDGEMECWSGGQRSSAQYAATPILQDPGSYVPKTIKSEIRRRGRLPANECVEIALALTTALAHLHKNGLVHRDIKPSNIIYVNGRPKLADIGLVTGVDATRSYVGTEGFAPPEGPGTPPADIYALGKVLYEMSTGRDRQEFPELPTRLGGSAEEEKGLLELNEVLLRACEGDPRRRYQTAEAMQADLAHLKRGKSLARKRSSERRLAILVKAGAVLVVLAIGAALVMRQRLANQERRYTAAEQAASPKEEEQIPDSRVRFASFADAMRSKASQYPRLTPGTVVGKHAFTRFRLNANPVRWGNVYNDAVRFTTPAATELDMAWAVTLHNRNRSFSGWMLIALEDSANEGFRTWFRRPATEYEALAIPADHRVYVQGLPGQRLDPSREYLLCFEFQDAQPVDFHIAMNFVPVGVCSETNQVSLENALGLVVIERTPETLKAQTSEPANR